jgi:hypothetical protein
MTSARPGAAQRLVVADLILVRLDTQRTALAAVWLLPRTVWRLTGDDGVRQAEEPSRCCGALRGVESERHLAFSMKQCKDKGESVRRPWTAENWNTT